MHRNVLLGQITAFSSNSYRIRRYGSTFYIEIAMVYFCTMGKLKFLFSLSVSSQFDLDFQFCMY